MKNTLVDVNSNPIAELYHQADMVKKLYGSIEAFVKDEMAGHQHNLYLTTDNNYFQPIIVSINSDNPGRFPVTVNGVARNGIRHEINNMDEFRVFLRDAFNSQLCIEILRFLIYTPN